MKDDSYISLLPLKDSSALEGYPQCAVIRCQNQDYGIRIHHAGRVSFSSQSSAPDREHQHAVYHVVLFLENQDFFQVNGQLHPAKPGVLVITSPKDRHSFVPYYRHPMAYTEIAFEVSGQAGVLEVPFVEILTSLFGGRYKSPVFPILTGKRQQKELCDQIQILVQELIECKGQVTGRVLLRLLGILNFLAEEFYEESRPVSSLRVLAPLELVKLEIERKYNQPLSISELAEIADLSPNYFLTAFRKRFNITPIQYQQDLRLKRAQWLLKNTELRCQAIADEVGYHDLFFFSKIFKKAIGLPPGSFRRAGRTK